MKTVDIAMATYNGEHFIEEQIKSIQAQTYDNWQLYISDDGSKDNTTNLIEKMMHDDSRIKLINTKRQGGVINNFNKVLMATTAEYVLLCDQDDIWINDRLEKLVNKIEGVSKDQDVPKMVFTDLELVNEKGETIASSFYSANKLNASENLEKNNLIWRSTIYGCTTIVNRKLLEKSLPIPEYAQMHDQWLALNAIQSDGLYYFDYQSLKYRQHGNNVVGGSHKGVKGKLSNFRKSLKNIKISVLKIKSLLRDRSDLTSNKDTFNSYFDFIMFAFKEIMPKVFVGDKKIQTLFIFIGFLILK
ncbi:glycosyltransferase family 2 protein [Acinetobacter nosocomialis]|uniref:glycosyltransferase family 2 protein n=1 Tax=Acinetobacter nosocomialis TaxID=106654 RepID=UPI00244A973C|nr:glycosyltransferase family 2 protein [Acinetobacter nosocomialis]MDH2636575.1 glycosyltransferase family 2 protein [Acinetobacter nosocomialis]